VPRAEVACGRVGNDGEGMVAQLVMPALRSHWGQLLAWPPAGVFAWRGESSPTCVGSGARALGLRRVSWPTHKSEPGEVEQGRDFSCEAATSRARQRLVLGIPLVGNWSEVQPTGRRLDVLPVWVLT
jgi:hypothetical protein